MSFALPNDVLLLVGDFIEDHEDRYNLIFVCRHFHDLFLRTVYRDASLRNCTQLKSFLAAILRRPELARAVRTLDFDEWQTPSAGETHDDLSVFSTLIENVSQSDEEYAKWEQDLRKGSAEAWIALLLPLVSNVKQLNLVYPKENTYLDRTMQRAIKGDKPFDKQPALRALEQVSMKHLDDEDCKGSYMPSQLLPFFRFPSMQSISADSVVESTSQPDQTEPVDSSISEIHLTTSNGPSGMDSLISCSSLKSFKYQHSDNHLLAEGYQPSAFYRSLASSKNTLETLWLDSHGTHYPFTITGANETHDEWFGSLTDFTVLKDIRIRLPNLLDIRYQPDPATSLPDILPKSVESLYIEGCKENSLSTLIAQLKLVLSKRRSRFPNLRTVDIEGFFHDEEDYEDSGYDASAVGAEKTIKPRVYSMAEPLHASCAEAEIQLNLRDRDCPSTMVGSV
ncbi:hypothetical protein ASPWEDRAFT_44672 [Aspergillus wentii DTO 134E9]|uniref:Leucine-rich repeat domain-containing protein n=1 Tax=Aspergillus wentii DTO 134E9 TaxID=1073089 RepID=A0A1L9RCD3_ASPWE|nr:uncharacterized protein ASPWEDRAFT_44672 [Aspergillus wentii DTO 134E9]KAI9935082.1 hypothetical protein MW887_000703 [Aspergillus wentii]OJJ32523.1 hypothetical protein ASPWEDRAFT_44672 [Aspergillus wentii DTO 134E9]